MADLKTRQRTSIRAARRALLPEQRQRETDATCRLLLELLAPVADLAAYVAMPGELDLQGFFQAWMRPDRHLWLPRVSGPGLLSWHPVGDLGLLRPGSYGISEPDPQLTPAADLPEQTVILVPGVAFDGKGGRLGQGGGFYDRVIAGRRTIGVGFHCQLVDSVVTDTHDQRVSGLVIGGALTLVPPWA